MLSTYLQHHQDMFIRIFCCFCLGYSLSLFAENRALLIGIDEYQSIDPIIGSVQDAKQMYRFIQQQWGFSAQQIRLLSNQQATRAHILHSFDQWLIAGSQPGDRVLFYYSGHGYYLADDNQDEQDGYDETLCPTDVALTPKGQIINMIRDDEIDARLQKLAGREVLVILDACHSGTATRSPLAQRSNRFIKRPVFKHLTRGFSVMNPADFQQHQQEQGFITKRPNLTVLSAVSANQIAIVDIEARPYQGVFTRRLIAGIEQRKADANGDGQVSVIELLDYTRRESQAYCDRHQALCNQGHLTPQLESSPQRLSQALFSHSPLVVPSGVTAMAAEAATVLSHDNPAGLTLRLLPSAQVQIGELFQFEISSQHPGQLMLFAIDPAGALHFVFPSSSCQGRNRTGHLNGGETLLIPDAHYGCQFRGQGPVGRGRLLAILIAQGEAALHRDLSVVATLQGQPAQAWLARLRQHLDALVHQEDGGNRALRWSMTQIDYQVTQ